MAALAAWTDRYDSGEWDDPPGKLALLFDLERVSALLRDGLDPFHPERDRPAFLAHLFANRLPAAPRMIRASRPRETRDDRREQGQPGGSRI